MQCTFIMKIPDNPQIVVRVSQFEFKKFRELKDKHGLSAREVLEYSCCPCEKCNPFVTIFDKVTDEQIQIPKGILSKRYK